MQIRHAIWTVCRQVPNVRIVADQRFQQQEIHRRRGSQQHSHFADNARGGSKRLQLVVVVESTRDKIFGRATGSRTIDSRGESRQLGHKYSHKSRVVARQEYNVQRGIVRRHSQVEKEAKHQGRRGELFTNWISKLAEREESNWRKAQLESRV